VRLPWAWIYVAPIVLLAVTWFRILRAEYFDEAPRIAWLPLIVASASEAYLALATFSRDLMGPAHSSLRYNLIGLNLAIVLLVAAIVCFWKSIARWWLFAASLSLALQWIFVDLINHVVVL
jgi:hypothetical protein